MKETPAPQAAGASKRRPSPTYTASSQALGVPTPQWPQVRQHLLFGAAFRRSMVTPGSANALRAWAAAGLQLAAITQNQRPGAVDWLTHHELTQVAGGPLALVVESSVVGLSKPDPEIVRYALRSLGRNAHVPLRDSTVRSPAEAAGVQIRRTA